MPRTKETRNFSGSVFRREIKKDGKTITVWDARKRYKNADGENKEKFKRCRSQKEASIALTNFQNEITAGLAEENTKKQDATFFQLVEYFKKEYVKEAVFTNGRQITGYRQNLNNIKTILDEQKEFFGNLPLRRINYETVKNYAEFAATKKTNRKDFPAVSTVNQKLSFLRRVFNVAIQLDLLDANPFKRGGRLIHKAAERRRNRMMTYDEERRLLAACSGRQEYLRAWIICAVDTAMRRSDIYRLRWKDVDLKLNVIFIEAEKSKDGIRSKTGVAGILPVTPRLRIELLKIKETANGGEANDLVFGVVDFKKSFKRLMKRAKIDDLQFRDLRSTAATRMLLAGNANALVRKITRHTGDDILIDHYTNIDVENARLVGEKLAEFNELQTSKVKDKGNETFIESDTIM